MSIQEFGESLLADVRQRKDEQYEQYMRDQRKAQKRAEKEARKQALLGVGLRAATGVVSEMGNTFLANKTEEFLNNSGVYDNALTMKNATDMQTNALKREQEVVGSDKDPLSYFTEQAMNQVASIVDNEPKFNSSKLSKKKLDIVKSMAATHLGKQLLEAHKEQLTAANKLASGDITHDAYMKEIQKVAPTNMTRYIYGKLTGVFNEGGEDPITSSLRLNGILDKAEKEKAYYTIFKDSRDGFTAASIFEVMEDNGLSLENLAVGESDISYGKAYTVEVPSTDILGNTTTTKRTVKDVFVNGVLAGVPPVDAVSLKALAYSVDTTEKNEIAYSKIAEEDLAVINAKIRSNATEDERNILNSMITVKAGSTKADDYDKQYLGARRLITGRILKTKNNFTKLGVPEEVATQVAIKTNALRYEGIMSKDVAGFSYLSDEMDFTKDIMPNNSQSSLAMYMGLELAEKEGLRIGIPPKKLLAIKANLLNSIQKDGFQTYAQRTYLLGVTDAEGKVVEEGLIDDPRFSDLNLREKLLSVPMNRQVSASKPSLDGKAIPTEEEKEIFFKYKDNPAFLLDYDKYFVRPENIEPNVTVSEKETGQPTKTPLTWTPEKTLKLIKEVPEKQVKTVSDLLKVKAGLNSSKGELVDVAIEGIASNLSGVNQLGDTKAEDILAGLSSLGVDVTSKDTLSRVQEAVAEREQKQYLTDYIVGGLARAPKQLVMNAKDFAETAVKQFGYHTGLSNVADLFTEERLNKKIQEAEDRRATFNPKTK